MLISLSIASIIFSLSSLKRVDHLKKKKKQNKLIHWMCEERLSKEKIQKTF